MLAALAAGAEKQPFSRYESIVERQMFGPLPPDFDPNKPPNEVLKTVVSDKQLTKEQEKLQSSIHFSVINITPDGATAVGFTDNSDPKAPVHYYLKVGEKRNGWEVIEADAAAATMTIARGDIQVSLSLGGNSAKGAGTTSYAGAAAAIPQPPTPRHGGSLRGLSLRERRQQRMAERAAAEAAAKKAAEEQQAEQEAREAERQAQMQQERQQRESEREEQRRQLMAIREELKKVREAKDAERKKASEEGAAGEEN